MVARDPFAAPGPGAGQGQHHGPLSAGMHQQPPPAQSPTTQGVRADSDRHFERMKQEEKAHQEKDKNQQLPAGSGY